MKNSLLKLSILLFLTASFLLGSCSEKTETEELEEQEELEEVSQGSEDYQPLTEGSWWEYESEDFLGNPYTYRLTVSTETKMVNGNEYVKFEIDIEGAESYFFRCDESYCYRNGDSFVLGDNYELPYLKIDAPVGTTWTFDYDYNGNPNQYFMSIEETAVTRTVKGVEYTDVVKVKRQHWYNNPLDGVWTESEDFDSYFWYAKGIGRIEINDLADINTYLLDYEIK